MAAEAKEDRAYAEAKGAPGKDPEAKEAAGSKTTDDDDGMALLLRVAHFFQRKKDEQVVYGGDRHGGLEVIFEDFCDEHAHEFLTESVRAALGIAHGVCVCV